MHRLSLALSLTLLAAACAPRADDAAPDSSGMAATAPAGIDMAAVAGTWDLQVMGATSDSVLTTGTLTATADTAGWILELKDRAPMAVHVTIDGDSVVTRAPEYESVLRPGVKVQTTSVYRLVGGNLSGSTTAVYRGVGADSVVMLRATGTKRAM